MSKCYCGSSKVFSKCCEPIINSQDKANSPEDLMRARYSAYVLGNIDFIESSLHPKSRASFDKQSAKQWSAQAKWAGLEIIETLIEENAKKGIVEFKAHYTIQDQKIDHHERAEFVKEEGQWYFLDGKQIGPEPTKRDPKKVGRNDPCSCGSGKKYKKCCG